jgi:beta-1,4-mannosyltransferase
MVLALGQIRAYKGLGELVEAFQSLGENRRAELWLAGEPVDAELAEELHKVADREDDVHVRAEFLSPVDVDALLKASDVVALPYRAILTSGAAILAMSFARACVAPRLGCLPEVLDEEGAFFYDSTDTDGLRNALERALAARCDLPAMGRHNRERIEPWDWDRAADTLLHLYRRLAPFRFGPPPQAGEVA